MRIIFIFLVFSILTLHLNAQVQYPLILDKTLTSIAAGEDLLTFHKALYTVENQYLKSKLFDEQKWYNKALGISYRTSKYILIDLSIDYLTRLIQHEVYGHGARYREYGFIDNHYTLNLPIPNRSTVGGLAFRGKQKNGAQRVLSDHENMAILFGGMEAQTIMANQLLLKWLNRGKINYRETILYFRNYHGYTGYVLGSDDNSGGDPVNYLARLNYHYGYFNNQEFALTLDQLKTQALINIFNPFQYFALYAFYKTHLWSGKEESGIPMISIRKIKFMPSVRLGLTPFGPEYYFENFVKLDNKVVRIYYRHGDRTFETFWGAGYHVMNLLDNQFFYFNTELNIWDQPALILGGESLFQTNGNIGGALSGTFILKMLTKEYPLNIYAQVGYKTAGYLEGEVLDKTMILRLGISFEERNEGK